MNEKFYKRYICGVILGIIGSCIIILNENKLAKENKSDSDSSFSDVMIGLFSMIANITIAGVVWVVNKIMATKRISLYAQLFYFGIFHTSYGFLWMLFTMDFDYNILYLLLCSTQAILFFLGNHFSYIGLKLIDLNKISIIKEMAPPTIEVYNILSIESLIYS